MRWAALPSHPLTPSPQAEGEGLEPPSGLRRRLFSRQVPHPAGCLPFVGCGGWKPGTFTPSPPHPVTPSPQGCGGRNRTCVVAVNGRLPVPARAPPHNSFGDATRVVLAPLALIVTRCMLRYRTSRRSICRSHRRCCRVGMLRSSVHFP